MNGLEFWLCVRDSDKEQGSSLLGGNEQDARDVVKHVLDQFVCEGYVVFRGFTVPNVWIARRGDHHAVVQLITTGVN